MLRREEKKGKKKLGRGKVLFEISSIFVAFVVGREVSLHFGYESTACVFAFEFGLLLAFEPLVVVQRRRMLIGAKTYLAGVFSDQICKVFNEKEAKSEYERCLH